MTDDNDGAPMGNIIRIDEGRIKHRLGEMVGGKGRRRLECDAGRGSGPFLWWVYSQPGKPRQNAYVERYNRTVRTEWPGRYHVTSIEEAQDHATRRLWTDNNERPNMGSGAMTPIQKLKAA